MKSSEVKIFQFNFLLTSNYLTLINKAIIYTSSRSFLSIKKSLNCNMLFIPLKSFSPALLQGPTNINLEIQKMFVLRNFFTCLVTDLL